MEHRPTPIGPNRRPHFRILPPEPQELPSESVELASGDTVGLGHLRSRGPVGPAVMLSVDDIDRTLPRASGEVGFPTILLTPGEARWLASQHIRRARLVEQ